MFVNVIVNVSASNVDRQFEYAVPKYLEDFITVGARIKIPFGQSDRPTYGFITDIHENQEYTGELKEIDEVPDLKPVINEEQFELAKFLKKTTFSPMVRILNAMIPAALKMKTAKYLHCNDLEGLDADVASLFSKYETINYNQYVSKFAGKIKKAIKDKKIEIVYDIFDNNKLAFKDIYLFNKDNYLKYQEKIKEQVKDALNNIREQVMYEKVDLHNLGLTDYYITKLIELDVLKKTTLPKSRIIERAYEINDDYYLSYASNEALRFYEQLKKIDPLYNKEILWIPKNDMEIIQGISLNVSDNIKKDLTTLVVVPDILSSFKIADLIKRFLGIPVLVINSNIHDGESLDSYNSLENGDYKVVVTTPVGILWPYKNIGSIFVLDEESDNYYNDQSPRYDVKEVMKFRGIYNHAKCIMVSYTPELDLFSKGLQSKIKMIGTSNYLQGQKDGPNVTVVDMKEELQNGNVSPISEILKNTIIKTIENKKVALLILNNKGYSDFVLCRNCGHVEKCEKCQISLKYQEKNNRLYCPSCGKQYPFDKTCSACGSKQIKFMGLGAEKLKTIVEEEIEGSKVIIIDEPKYSRFKEQIKMINDLSCNVVIATDTYSRGLSSTNIGMVGIMSLDLLLKSPGYKANQKGYSMLVHAGKIIERDNKGNPMIIQTYEKDHFVIKSFVTNSYVDYFKQELSYRNILEAPPYYMVNRIIVKADYDSRFKIAYKLIKFIKNKTGDQTIVLGPAYNYTEGGVQIIIKHKFINILPVYQEIYEEYQETDINVIIDCYPRSIL